MSYYKSARQSQSNEGLMAKIREHAKPSAASSSVPVRGGRQAYAVRAGGEYDVPSGIEKILAGAVEVGITGTKAEDVARLLAPDAMEPALHIMADVRAYFQSLSTNQHFKTPLTPLRSCLQTLRGQYPPRHRPRARARYRTPPTLRIADGATYPRSEWGADLQGARGGKSAGGDEERRVAPAHRADDRCERGVDGFWALICSCSFELSVLVHHVDRLSLTF